MDCSLPGSSVHGILQARILEWVAISFSRGSSQPRNRTQVSHIAGRRFNLWATRGSDKAFCGKHLGRIVNSAKHLGRTHKKLGFPCGSAGKESACNVGDLGSIPGLGRSPGEGKGYSLQYSGLENPMDCMYSPWGRIESDTTERLSRSPNIFITDFMICHVYNCTSHNYFNSS